MNFKDIIKDFDNFNKALKDLLSLNDKVLIKSNDNYLYLYTELEIYSHKVLQCFKRFEFIANEQRLINLLVSSVNGELEYSTGNFFLDKDIPSNDLKTLYSLNTSYQEVYESYHTFKLSDRYKQEASKQGCKSVMITLEGYGYEAEAYLNALKLFDGEVEGEIKEGGYLEFVKDNTVAILSKIN